MAHASSLPALFDDDDDDEYAPTRLDARPFALEETAPRLELVGRAAPPPLPPAARPATQRDSFIRTRPSPAAEARAAREFLAGAGEDHLTLSVNLLCLEDPTTGVPAWDLSARAAASSLRARVDELAQVRDALAHLLAHAEVERRLAPALGPDASLSAYVKGLYLWTLDVTAALTDLARGLRSLGPDWSALRARLDESNDWYFDELPGEIRDELARAGVSGEAADHVEELFFAAGYLAAGLSKRFG